MMGLFVMMKRQNRVREFLAKERVIWDINLRRLINYLKAVRVILVCSREFTKIFLIVLLAVNAM